MKHSLQFSTFAIQLYLVLFATCHLDVAARLSRAAFLQMHLSPVNDPFPSLSRKRSTQLSQSSGSVLSTTPTNLQGFGSVLPAQGSEVRGVQPSELRALSSTSGSQRPLAQHNPPLSNSYSSPGRSQRSGSIAPPIHSNMPPTPGYGARSVTQPNILLPIQPTERKPVAERIQCSFLFDRIALNRAIWESPTVKAFYLMYRGLTGQIQRQIPNADIDKLLSKALHLIGDHFLKHGSALTWTLFNQLLGCSVDDRNRTFLMKIIMMGLTQTLRDPLTFQLRGSEQLVDMKDLDGNNLVHLAVQSKNVEVVNYVLSFVRGKDKNSVLQLLNAKNNANETPRDIAVKLWRNDIVSSLQSHHATFQTLAMVDEIDIPTLPPGQGLPDVALSQGRHDIAPVVTAEQATDWQQQNAMFSPTQRSKRS